MKAAPDIRGRTDGWINICCLPIPGTRETCGLRYWYAAHKHQRMAIGVDGEASTEPHVCRSVVPAADACPRGRCDHHAAEHKNRLCIWPDCPCAEPEPYPNDYPETVAIPVAIERPTVARMALDGTVGDTYATEAEANGWRASQAALFDRGRPVRTTSPLQGALL